MEPSVLMTRTIYTLLGLCFGEVSDRLRFPRGGGQTSAVRWLIRSHSFPSERGINHEEISLE
jgi:hypothetical protein